MESQSLQYSFRDAIRIPGLLSLSRIPIAIVAALLLDHPAWSFGLFALSGLTDILDGWYARRFHQATPTGRLLDPVTDKLFVFIVVGALLFTARLSIGQVVMLGIRDIGELVIVGGLAASRRLFVDHPPNPFGKATTFLQFIVLALAVVRSSALVPFVIATGVLGLLATTTYGIRELGLARVAKH